MMSQTKTKPDLLPGNFLKIVVKDNSNLHNLIIPFSRIGCAAPQPEIEFIRRILSFVLLEYLESG